jgi:hypothetical protein
MTLSLCLALALFAAPQGDGELELRIEGPLEVLHLDGVRVRTRVLLDLAPSESVTLRVPWLPLDDSVAPQLRVAEGEGNARVEEIHPAPMAAPSALIRRPLPRPVEQAARISATAWWVFAAGLLAVWASRRRPIGALFVGALFGVISCALPQKRALLPAISVLEVGPAGAWWVHVAPERLSPVVGTQLELETVPEGAPWEWVIDAMDPSRPQRLATAGAGTLLVGRSPGPVVTWLDGERGLEGVEALGDWSELWRRSARGEWSQHGPWGPGGELTPSYSGRILPTWLRSGAAPGAQVWLGRLSDAPSGINEAWVRAIWPSEK